MYMSKCKKIAILICVFLSVLNIAACGQVQEDKTAKEPSANQQENNVPMGDNTEAKKDEPVDAEEPPIDQQGNSTQDGSNSGTKEGKTANTVEPTMGSQEDNNKATVDETLDAFINGSISAVDPTDQTTFSITDLNMDSDEWYSYSVGDREDLDNDGENELIICGPYGGIYLDVRDGKVYQFAAGEGDSLVLSYVVYNGSTWVMYSNRMHTGYEVYHMEKYEGADNLVAEMNFNEELVDEDNVEGEEKYTLNGTEISYEEYYELCSKIFATEVNTN